MNSSEIAERKAEQRRVAIGFVVGLIVMLAGVTIVLNDRSSPANWIIGLIVVLAGALVEEKFILRRRK